jgi:hypothetical protein
MNVYLSVLTPRLYLMSNLEPFLKVPLSLIDNEVLNSHEKYLLMLLTRLRTAKRGCCPSHVYLMKKMGLKDKRTLIRHLDRLQLFGYITWENRGKNKTNLYYFRGDDNFQAILSNNIKLRKFLSEKHKKIYVDKVMKKFVDKKGIRLIK